MCKPLNENIKEFKWRPGIFQKRLDQMYLYSDFNPILRDERFCRIFPRLVLFADLESFNIQPPCHWNYKLAPVDLLKVKMGSNQCSCDMKTDQIQHMEMNKLQINKDGETIFASDHDVDFGFGRFKIQNNDFQINYDIQLWTNAEEEKVVRLVEKMKRSDEKTRKRVKSQIVKFIDKTMATFEREVLQFEFCAAIKPHLPTFLLQVESISSAELKQAPTKLNGKRTMTSRQKRLQADAIQAVKDAEEAKMKQLEQKKSETNNFSNQGTKKTAKAHNFFRKSQKPAKL